MKKRLVGKDSKLAFHFQEVIHISSMTFCISYIYMWLDMCIGCVFPLGRFHMVFSLMGDVRGVFFFGVDLSSQKRDQFSSRLVVAGVVLVGMQLVDVRWSSRKYCYVLFGDQRSRQMGYWPPNITI